MSLQNYNKSRIHSFRGARYLEVSLDGQYIFKGEIARACGGTQGGTESFGDVCYNLLSIVVNTRYITSVYIMFTCMSCRLYYSQCQMIFWMLYPGMMVSMREATSQTNGKMISHSVRDRQQQIKAKL